MKKLLLALLAAGTIGALCLVPAGADDQTGAPADGQASETAGERPTPAVDEVSVPPAPNGIEMPEGYRDWPVLASSCRSDNNTMRVILGNAVAMKAAAEGKTNPWPDGTTFAKLVWKQSALEAWPSAAVPGDFVHAEFMIKDAAKYASTGGWGFARWLGLEQRPYGEDANFAQTCFECHTPVADNDYVFGKPAVMPSGNR